MVKPYHIFLFAACCAAATAFGDDFPPPSGTDSSEAFLAAPLELVSTPARGNEVDAVDVPQAISTINRQSLNHSEHGDVNAILRTEANVGAASLQDNPSYWDEGIMLRGFESENILMMSNGVRQSGLGFGGGSLSLYDPYSIERIEVLRGPSSVLYGSGPIGGVVNIVTRSPSERTEFGANSGARYVYDGAENANRAGAYFDVGNRDFGLIAGGSFINSDVPNLPGDNDADNGSFRNGSGWSKGVYHVTHDTTLRLTGDLNHNSDVLLADRPELSASLPKYQRSLLGTEVEIDRISDLLDSFTSGVSWQQIRRDMQMDSAAPLFSNDTVNTIDWQNTAQMKLRQQSITAGFDLSHDGADLGEAIGPDVQQYRFGLFAQDDIRTGDFDFIPGARLDYNTVRNGMDDFSNDRLEPSGSLGALYHLTEHESVYANLASAYRMPNLSERFGQEIISTGTPVAAIGNQNLRPEHAYSAELGAKGLQREYNYSAATFISHVDNFIGRQNINAETEQFENLGSLNLYGVEASGAYKITDEVEIFGNAGRTWNTDSEKADVPAWLFNYGVRYVQGLCDCTGLKEFTAALVARSATDSSDNVPANATSPFPPHQAFTTLNLESTLEVAQTSFGKAMIVGGLRNILNEHYREPYYTGLQPGFNAYIGAQLEY